MIAQPLLNILTQIRPRNSYEESLLGMVFRHKHGYQVLGADGETPHILRVYLTPRGADERQYLHCILSADQPDIYHYHPESGFAEIVLGSYKESFCDPATGAVTSRVLSKGMSNTLSRSKYHRVEPIDGPVWTFVHRNVEKRSAYPQGWLRQDPATKKCTTWVTQWDPAKDASASTSIISEPARNLSPMGIEASILDMQLAE
jgi:hypothetical protein